MLKKIFSFIDLQSQISRVVRVKEILRIGNERIHYFISFNLVYIKYTMGFVLRSRNTSPISVFCDR